MEKDSFKDKTNAICNTFIYAVKNGQLKRWFYEFQHGHPFLLSEEADIILRTRLHLNQLINDEDIKDIVKLRVKEMYKKKFPNAKKWSFPIFSK